MVKAVFIQNPNSIYDDKPGEAYHFPKRYLKSVLKTVGDWVIFYEGKSGAFGYVSVQKVLAVAPDNNLPDYYYALLDRGSEWSFERTVPRANANNIAWESSLRGALGQPTSGGANVSAVRILSDAEFGSIVNYGLTEITSSESFPRDGPLPVENIGFSEGPAHFEAAPLEIFREDILTSRKARDASFSRQVKAAYSASCAISGLSLRNGKGRPEVQAAHIRPVKFQGPDKVSNGLALSGTIHWMFDRGLISVAEDWSIIVSGNKVPRETAHRLFAPGQKLILPDDRQHYPNPEYLRFHREEIFGQLN